MARWGARRPQGILLYGPPGTGKTMLARALANEIGADFREIRTPEILDKWLGASERNIKRIFREARRYRHPTVMLFDEFDSIISYAGAGGTRRSQAVNAVAGIFKQEMNDLIEDNPNVIVVATTNFPRPGRRLADPLRPLRRQAGHPDARRGRPGRDLDQDDPASSPPGTSTPGSACSPTTSTRPRSAAASHGMTGADIGEVLRRVQLAKAMQEARGGPGDPISQADLVAAIAAL